MFTCSASWHSSTALLEAYVKNAVPNGLVSHALTMAIEKFEFDHYFSRPLDCRLSGPYTAGGVSVGALKTKLRENFRHNLWARQIRTPTSHQPSATSHQPPATKSQLLQQWTTVTVKRGCQEEYNNADLMCSCSLQQNTHGIIAGRAIVAPAFEIDVFLECGGYTTELPAD